MDNVSSGVETATPSKPGSGSSTASRPRGYSRGKMVQVWIAAILTLPLWLSLLLLTTFVKRLPNWLTAKLLRAHDRYTTNHKMDFRIPPPEDIPAYMLRWWRIPRNAFLNIYYHIVLRSDDDRAHHDHPFWSFSIVLLGGYYEHTIAAGGIHHRKWCGPGMIKFRWSGKFAHRLELERFHPGNHHLTGDGEIPAKTIFITGPVLRRWGFHDGPRGWIDAYDWDRHCEEHGIKSMPMAGGSDAVTSSRNHHKRTDHNG